MSDAAAADDETISSSDSSGLRSRAQTKRSSRGKVEARSERMVYRTAARTTSRGRLCLGDVGETIREIQRLLTERW